MTTDETPASETPAPGTQAPGTPAPATQPPRARATARATRPAGAPERGISGAELRNALLNIARRIDKVEQKVDRLSRLTEMVMERAPATAPAPAPAMDAESVPASEPQPPAGRHGMAITAGAAAAIAKATGYGVGMDEEDGARASAHGAAVGWKAMVA